MAAPTITWKNHTSTTDVNGSTITTLSLGTVTAGQWSDNVAVSVYVATNAVSNLKLWLADSYGVVNGSNVSLGESGKEWDFKVTAVATVSGQGTLFGGDGTGISGSGTTLATNYRVSPSNSLGAGKSLGSGTSNSVGISTRSKAAFLSVQPHASAYDGQHTQFSFQVGYDFT